MKTRALPYIFGLLIVQCITLEAQVTIGAELVEVPVVAGNFEVIGYNKVTNTSAETTTYVWTRVISESNDPWEISVCDTNSCYLPFVDEMEFELPGGTSGKLDIHLKHFEKFEGKAVVEMTVVEKDNPSNSVSATYIFEPPSSTTSVASQEIVIYPNPSSGFIQVEAKGMQSIHILDLSGRLVRTYNGNLGQLDITDLPRGSYFVRGEHQSGLLYRSIIIRE